jgi:hypothetical protein
LTLYLANVALFTIPQYACPNIHVAWHQVMYLTNEMYLNIPMKARNTNGAAFRVNTYIRR